jgi:5-formyltetrahydrofolate cyclo-ligase
MTQNTAPSLRTRLRAARKNIVVADRLRGSLLIRARLFTWLALAREQALLNKQNVPRVIAAYWPLSDEPDLTPLIEKWLNEVDHPALTVVLPVVVSDHAPLNFYPYTALTELKPDPFGVMAPVPSHGQTSLIPDVVLVPTLGFTQRGDRIGYGKGFYDRTLASLRQQNPKMVAIGIAWNEGSIEAIEPQYRPAPHDFVLNYVLTPTDWWPARQPPQARSPT